MARLVSDRSTSRRLLGGSSSTSGSSSLSNIQFGLKPRALQPQAKSGGFLMRTAVPEAAGPTVIPDAPQLQRNGNAAALADVLGSVNKNLVGFATKGIDGLTQLEIYARDEAEAIAGQNPGDDEEDPDKQVQKLNKKLQKIVGKEGVKNYSVSERNGAQKLLSQLNDGRVERHLKSILKRNEVRNRALNIKQLANGATVDDGEGNQIPLQSIPSTDPRYSHWVHQTIYGGEDLNSLEYEEISPTIVNQTTSDRVRQDKAHDTHLTDLFTETRDELMINAGNLLSNGDIDSARKDVQTIIDAVRKLRPNKSEADYQKLTKGIVEALATSYLLNDKGTGDGSQLYELFKEVYVGPTDQREIVVKGKTNPDGTPVTKPNEKLNWLNQKGGKEYLRGIIADVSEKIRTNDEKNDKFQQFSGENRAHREFKKEVIPLITAGNKTKALEKISELVKAYQKDAILNNVDIDVQGEVQAHYMDLYKDYVSTDDATINQNKIGISRLLLAGATNPTKLFEAEVKLEEMEDKFGHDETVLEFVRKSREQLSRQKATAASDYSSNLENKIEELSREFLATARSDDSYGGADPDIEFNMNTEGRIRGFNIGNQIIEDGLKKGLSTKDILKNLSEGITKESLGFVLKSEIKEEPTGPLHSGGLSSVDTEYGWLKGDIKNPQANDLNNLNKALDSNQPMFDYKTIQTAITNARENKGQIDIRLARVLKATGRKQSDFFINQLTKNGHIPTEQEKIELRKLDKVKL